MGGTQRPGSRQSTPAVCQVLRGERVGFCGDRSVATTLWRLTPPRPDPHEFPPQLLDPCVLVLSCTPPHPFHSLHSLSCLQRLTAAAALLCASTPSSPRPLCICKPPDTIPPHPLHSLHSVSQLPTLPQPTGYHPAPSTHSTAPAAHSHLRLHLTPPPTLHTGCTTSSCLPRCTRTRAALCEPEPVRVDASSKFELMH